MAIWISLLYSLKATGLRQWATGIKVLPLVAGSLTPEACFHNKYTTIFLVIQLFLNKND
jgi:hypothetical protein